MRLNRFFLLVLSLAGFQVQALTFEPYYGIFSNAKNVYQHNGAKAATLPDVYTDTLKGNGYGLRASQSYYSIFLGADYFLANGKLKVDPDVGDPDGQFKMKALYGVAGFGQPGSFRIWYAHGIKSEFEREDSGVVTKLKGDSYKVGICIGLSWFSINAEYLKWKFKKFQQGSSNGSIGDIFKRYDSDGIFLSLSIPFTF